MPLLAERGSHIYCAKIVSQNEFFDSIPCLALGIAFLAVFYL